MNRQEIIDKWNEMTDRERDAWVAKAKGFCVVDDGLGTGTQFYVPFIGMENGIQVPFYTTDWNYAGELFEEITSTGKGVNLILWRDDSLKGFAIDELLNYGNEESDLKRFITQPTPQRAICLAYLLGKLEAEDNP